MKKEVIRDDHPRRTAGWGSQAHRSRRGVSTWIRPLLGVHPRHTAGAGSQIKAWAPGPDPSWVFIPGARQGAHRTPGLLPCTFRTTPLPSLLLIRRKKKRKKKEVIKDDHPKRTARWVSQAHRTRRGLGTWVRPLLGAHPKLPQGLVHRSRRGHLDPTHPGCSYQAHCKGLTEHRGCSPSMSP